MKLLARNAKQEDSSMVLSWRNHDAARKYSKSTIAINEKEHENWFQPRLELLDSQPFWIFSHESQDVGYVRFEKSNEYLNSLEISICVNPNFYSKGFGQSILDQSISLIFARFPLASLIATYNNLNAASEKIFQKATFKEIKSDQSFTTVAKVNANIRFVMRADASTVIGTGHTQRSLGVIEELISLNYKTIFIGRISEIPWLNQKIKSVGFYQIFENEDEFISNNQNDILILDSYTVSPGSPFIDKKNWKFVVTIIDSSTPYYLADLKIHPGVAEILDLDKSSRLLSGPKYIPFRKSIQKLVQKSDTATLNVTVVGGGVDSVGFVEEMSRILSKIPGDFVASFFSNFPDKVTKDFRFNVFPLGDDLDKVGNKSDLVLLPSGSTSLEFLARGCAVGIACVYENQKQYYLSLSNLEVVAQIGEYEDGSWNLNIDKIKELLSSPELRNELSKKSSEIFDLEGAKRIVSEILSL
jgi:spore coat polysaccharide biosynthesis predicted glycosyltransferase SpsG/RimJ/RimL family protein N-acetyltransferase